MLVAKMDIKDIPSVEDDDSVDDDLVEIIIEDDCDLDEEEIEALEKKLDELQKFASKHLGKGKKTYAKQKNKILRDIKKSVEHMDILLLSHAYTNEDTYAGYLRKREELRKGLLKSFLAHMDEDAKVIIYQELYRDACGDDEPIDFYIF